MLNCVCGLGLGLNKSFCGNQSRSSIKNKNNVSFGLNGSTLSKEITQQIMPTVLHPAFVKTSEIENLVKDRFCGTLRTNTELAVEKAFKMKLFKKDGLDSPVTAILDDNHILKDGKVSVVLNEAKLIIPKGTLDRFVQMDLDVSEIPRLDLKNVSLVFDNKGRLIDFFSKEGILEGLEFNEKQRRLDKVFRAVKATVQNMINFASI